MEGQVRLARRDYEALDNRAAGTVDRVQDQTVSEDRVVPSVQYGPEPPPPVVEVYVTYRVSQHDINIIAKLLRGALMDRGANGGILGNDARVFHSYQREVDVTGIARNALSGLMIVDAAAKMMSNRGPVIGIMLNYAYFGKDRTIHSSGQLEHYGNIVDDRSMKVGGRQCICTHDGYILPLDIINGLPYLKMEKHTDQEWEELPHVVLTGPGQWDPSVLDNVITDHEDWVNTIKDLDEGLIQTPFDEFGNYRGREPTPEITIQQDLTKEEEPKQRDSREPTPLDADLDVDWHETKDADLRSCFKAACNLNAQYIVSDNDTVTTAAETVEDMDSDDDATVVATNPRVVKPKPVDYERYRPYFLHVPIEKVRKTFENTTQYAANVMSGLKSPRLFSLRSLQ